MSLTCHPMILSLLNALTCVSACLCLRRSSFMADSGKSSLLSCCGHHIDVRFVFFLGQFVFRSTLGVDFVGTFVLPLRVGISVGCWISCSTIMCGYLFCCWISLIKFYQILYLLLFRVMVEQKYQLSVHAKLSSYAWGECLRIFMSALPGCHCHDIWFWLVSSLLKSFPSLFTTLVYLLVCVY